MYQIKANIEQTNTKKIGGKKKCSRFGPSAALSHESMAPNKL